MCALVLASACSGHGAPDSAQVDAPLIEECQQYLAAYGTCARSLSPGKPEIAAARVDVTRAALARVTDLEQLKKTCADGTAQIRSSCH